MNSILKRQVEKYIPKELMQDDVLSDFLNAVERTYDNSEDQFKISQRAMKISSDELVNANKKLKEKALGQEKILNNLYLVFASLNLNVPTKENEEFDLVWLSAFIEKQSKELIKIHRQKEVLLKSLESKNQVLSDYAHMVSHDLKSPLRSINSLLNWIIEDNQELIDSNCKEKFLLIMKNLEKMDGLINGILNYSTIDQKILVTYKIDLFELVSEIKQILLIPEQITIEISKNLPVILSDKSRMQQLFQNLIQNAVNSVDIDSGKIEIGVEDNIKTWRFFIKDNGVGISPQHHKKIFKIFEKLDNNLDSTGIGLSIVKKIVDYYNGKIFLESELGVGTTFYVDLPK